MNRLSIHEEYLKILFGTSWMRIKILLLLSVHGRMSIDELYKIIDKEKRKYQYLLKHIKTLKKLNLIKVEGNNLEITSKGKDLANVLLKIFRKNDNNIDSNIEIYLAGHFKAMESLIILNNFIKDIGIHIYNFSRKYLHGFPVLLSLGVYWNSSKFITPKIPRDIISKLFIDSGAQQFYNKFNKPYYPYTPRDYIEIAMKLNPDFIATLDIPLDLVFPKRIMGIKEGIKKTVEYGIECISIAEKYNIMEKIVPVLQGYNNPEEWLECYDLYKEHGIDKKFKVWGIGSLCTAKRKSLVVDVISNIRKKVGKEIKLHVFGLSLNLLRYVYDKINSYDTSVWVYWSKMDGALFSTFPKNHKGKLKLRFMQFKSRKKHLYDTVELMALNALNVLIHNEILNLFKSFTTIRFR